MNLPGALFAFAMLFTVACYSASTETGDRIAPEILVAIEQQALIVDVRTPGNLLTATTRAPLTSHTSRFWTG